MKQRRAHLFLAVTPQVGGRQCLCDVTQQSPQSVRGVATASRVRFNISSTRAANLDRPYIVVVGTVLLMSGTCALSSWPLRDGGLVRFARPTRSQVHSLKLSATLYGEELLAECKGGNCEGKFDIRFNCIRAGGGGLYSFPRDFAAQIKIRPYPGFEPRDHRLTRAVALPTELTN